MWSTGKPNTNKRGAGSIIGGVFILLILLTGYTFYFLDIQVTEDYNKTLQDMDELDLKRNKENIEFTTVSFNDDHKLNITIKNIGSYDTHLIWLGIFNEITNTEKYYQIDYYVNPAETVCDIRNDTISTFEGQERTIQLVTELGNTFSYTYPPTEDEESAQASVTITGANCTATYNPSQRNLLGSTIDVSGSISDLASNDNNRMVFRSYYSGSTTDINHFVNETCDLHSPSAKGTHSNFTAQQYGPDSINDTLTEENTGSGSENTTLLDDGFEAANWDDNWEDDGHNWVQSSYQPHGGSYVARSANGYEGTFTCDNLDASDADTIYIDFYYRKGGTDTYDFTLYYFNGNNYNLIDELDDNGGDWEWLHWVDIITDSQYFVSNFRIRFDTTLGVNEYAYVDDVLIKKETTTENYELDLEVQWTNTDFDETNEELAIYVDRANNTHSLDATGGYMIIGDGTPDWGSTIGTISFWIKWDSVGNRPWGQHGDMEMRFSGSNLVLDWGAGSSLTSTTSFTTDHWYFIAIVWDENTDDLYLYVGDEDNAPTQDTYVNTWTSTVSTIGAAENNFMSSKGSPDPTDGHGDDLRYWNIDRTLADIQSDYDIELTGSETNLRSYFQLNNNFNDIGPDNNDGSGSGSYSFSSDVAFDTPPSENIQLDVWNGTAWQNLRADLINGWNNVSVTSYLTSSNLTIRFKDGTNTSDTAQNSWGIDATLLHVWTDADEYTAQVEFTGSSNLEDWTRLIWKVDSCWNVSQVTVTIQFYNYTLGGYAESGNGIISYVSHATEDTDELKSKTITSNPSSFKNSTGHWKIKIKGIKSTSTQFEMKIDWIESNITYSSSGGSIPYNSWQWYTTEAATAEGDPIPYAYISIYANGTNVSFRNAISRESVSNPGWVRLNANGKYYLELNSTYSLGETFIFYAVAGSVVGQKTITQEVQ